MNWSQDCSHWWLKVYSAIKDPSLMFMLQSSLRTKLAHSAHEYCDCLDVFLQLSPLQLPRLPQWSCKLWQLWSATGYVRHTLAVDRWSIARMKIHNHNISQAMEAMAAEQRLDGFNGLGRCLSLTVAQASKVDFLVARLGLWIRKKVSRALSTSTHGHNKYTTSVGAAYEKNPNECSIQEILKGPVAM